MRCVIVSSCFISQVPATNAPDNVVHAIHSLNMTQECISQPGSLTGSLDQPRNVRNLQIGRVLAGRVPDLAQEVLSSISQGFIVLEVTKNGKSLSREG